MGASRYLQDFAAASGQDGISADMFGANLVGRVNFAVEGGPYDAAVDALGVTHLRYPGGTVTEEQVAPGSTVWKELLATNGPGYATLPDGQRIQTLETTLDYASQHDLPVTLVLPSNFLLKEGPVGSRVPDIDAIDRMVKDLADFCRNNPEAAHLDAIEIGNEYYYEGRMTAEEYGQLANVMAQKLDTALGRVESDTGDETGFRVPDIMVQSGAGWQPGDNETILASLSDEAKAVIDGVLLHYYPKSLDAVGSFDRHLNELDDWHNDPAFGALRSYVSEWNIQNSATSDKGFMQASSFVSAFEEMVAEGIDMAAVWGTQYRSLDSRLTTLSKRDAGDEASQDIDSDLTATGEIFSIMSSSLVGTRVIDADAGRFISNATDQDFTTNVFGAENRLVAFIGSRDAEEEITMDLDLARYVGEAGHVSIRVLYPTDDPATAADEADPTDPNAEADLDFLYSGALDDSPLQLTLPPGAIAVVEVTLDDSGVLLEGQNPMSDEAFIDDEDTINGSDGDDTLRGHSGDDSLSGGRGADVLDGGAGADALSGQGGNDLLLGGAGNDTLSGGGGNDIAVDGDGDDRVTGNEGDDLLVDGEGDDTLSGGEGDDMILATAGDNLLQGGAGADIFVMGGAGHQTIADLSSEQGDRIDVSGHFEDEAALDEALDAALAEAGDTGKVTLALGQDSTLSFDWAGQDAADLRAVFGLEDGTEEEDTVQRLADILNGQDFAQVHELAATAGEDLFDALRDEDALGQLADALQPQALLGLLSGADDERAAELLAQVDDDQIMEAVAALPDEGVLDFLSGAGGERLEAIFDGVGLDAFDAWYDGLSPDLLREVDARLDGTSVPRPELDDTGAPPQPTHPLPPVTPDDEDEDEDGQPDDEEQAVSVGGDCFVATVAFRDPQHPAVWMLRWYRDNVLRHSAFGRALVALYWRVGPGLAQGLAGHPGCVLVLRGALHLLAWLIAFFAGRRMGRQADHAYWKENRACRLPLVRLPWDGR